MAAKKRLVTEVDFKRLNSILDDGASIDSESAWQLEERLASCKTISSNQVPGDLITMNSRVRGLFTEGQISAAQQHEKILTLVYPRFADISQGCISVATPIGIKLLAAVQGETVEWLGKDGETRRMLIEQVLYQPEASGDWHL